MVNFIAREYTYSSLFVIIVPTQIRVDEADVQYKNYYLEIIYEIRVIWLWFGKLCPKYTADRLLLQFHFQECYLKRSTIGVITENPIGVQYKLTK